MNDGFDFEKHWLRKLSERLEAVAGAEARVTIMEGSEGLSDESPRQDVIKWSKLAMNRLDSLVDREKRVEIMTGCACRYPKSGLQDVRIAYEAAGDVALAHQMLRRKFESFLRNDLRLDGELIAEIVGRGWGLAGLREGRSIIATKIPKSGQLVQYMHETDPEKRRQLYCHCPRIRDALKSRGKISATYCYCGAGFYKGIWEEITQEHVEVEVLESVLGGGETCRIAITLPQTQRYYTPDP